MIEDCKVNYLNFRPLCIKFRFVLLSFVFVFVLILFCCITFFWLPFCFDVSTGKFQVQSL